MADIYLSEGANELNIGLVPIPEPVASLYGTVTDADGYALPSVWVAIDGFTAYTDSYGRYEFAELTPGSYTVTFEKSGYQTVVRSKTLYEGDNELNIAFPPVIPPTAELYGTVTDADTGYALSGVKVSLDGLVDYTDSYGRYDFEGLTPGSYTIKFEKDGYETVIR